MKKPIIVRENGKKLKQKNISNVQTVHAEQAATLQESNEDPIPVFARSSDTDIKRPEKDSKFSYFKPIIIAILSAIVIGSILGFIMLRMFVGIETELSSQSSNTLPIVDKDQDNESAETNQSSLESIEAYVLQGGVFSEQANAEAWNKKFEDAGLSSMIWEKENQFFLLLGLANEKEQAKNILETVKKDADLDVFVKGWSTDKVKAELSKEEAEWFQSFRDQWTKALSEVSSQEALTPSSWENVVANYPKESDRAKPLAEAISNVKKAEGTQAQIDLLHLWNVYDQSLK